MLTKDLLRFNRNRQNRIFPRLVDTEDRAALGLATELSELYASGAGQSRDELAELSQPIINAYRSPMIARGINKLLLDRCLFLEPDPDVVEFRLTVFEHAAQLLAGHTLNHLEAFRTATGQAMGKPPETLTETLFADLPFRQPLKSFKPIAPQWLLHRYNMALAQGLLLSAKMLRLEFTETDPARLRQFFRRLKFFQLLATLSQTGGHTYLLFLDGPLSLLIQTRKYGIQFANILPAICHLSHWMLKADIRPSDGMDGFMQLDQESGLVSHYSQSRSTIPPEFEKFVLQLQNEAPQWTALLEVIPLGLGGQELVVPDFCFRHESGLMVHMELFHRWHKAPLLHRLARMEQPPSKGKPHPLVIAVDRTLAKDPDTLFKIEQSEWFKNHGFIFNQFPPVKRALKALESFC